MKKTLKILAWVVGLFIAVNVIASGFSTFDYSWRCTRRLREYHVVEKRFAGFTYSRKETLEFPGYDMTGLIDSPRQHIYRKGGYGEETYSLFSIVMADGITAEGNFFRSRWEALDAAFKLYQKFPNKDLMRETIDFADKCQPPDAAIDFTKNPHNKSAYLTLLALSLESAKSEQDWKADLVNIKSEIASDDAPK
jgi:hypothetical protein